MIRPHSALVITDPSISRSELIRLNQFCRSNKVSFFYAVTGGIWTSVFVDHGDHHIVNDPNGARPVQKLITSISKVEEGEEEDECLIRYDTPEGQPPESIDEGTFEISDVTGMEGVNGLIVNVSHPGKDAAKTVRAKIPNFGSMPKYVSGGILTEKKVPKAYPMSSLEEKMKNPGELIMTDLLTFCELHLHVAFVALLEYRSRFRFFDFVFLIFSFFDFDYLFFYLVLFYLVSYILSYFSLSYLGMMDKLLVQAMKKISKRLSKSQKN